MTDASYPVEDDRLGKILDAVGDVVLERGIHGVTTALVARRARVAPGKFYELFADKYAVVQAAADRNLTRFLTALVEALEDRPDVDLVEMGNLTLETWVDFCRRDPSFRVLRFEHAKDISAADDIDGEGTVVRAWVSFVSKRFELSDSPELERRLTLAMKLVLDPIDYAFELKPQEGDPEVIEQVRRILAYHLST